MAIYFNGKKRFFSSNSVSDLPLKISIQYFIVINTCKSIFFSFAAILPETILYTVFLKVRIL